MQQELLHIYSICTSFCMLSYYRVSFQNKGRTSSTLTSGVSVSDTCSSDDDCESSKIATLKQIKNH